MLLLQDVACFVDRWGQTRALVDPGSLWNDATAEIEVRSEMARAVKDFENAAKVAADRQQNVLMVMNIFSAARKCCHWKIWRDAIGAPPKEPFLDHTGWY